MHPADVNLLRPVMTRVCAPGSWIKRHAKWHVSHACSEGPACQLRRTTLTNPFHVFGHDKHAPPSPPRHVGLSSPLPRARQACPSEGPAPPRPSPHTGREIAWPPRVRGDKRGAACRQPSEGPDCRPTGKTAVHRLHPSLRTPIGIQSQPNPSSSGDWGHLHWKCLNV